MADARMMDPFDQALAGLNQAIVDLDGDGIPDVGLLPPRNVLAPRLPPGTPVLRSANTPLGDDAAESFGPGLGPAVSALDRFAGGVVRSTGAPALLSPLSTPAERARGALDAVGTVVPPVGALLGVNDAMASGTAAAKSGDVPGVAVNAALGLAALAGGYGTYRLGKNLLGRFRQAPQVEAPPSTSAPVIEEIRRLTQQRQQLADRYGVSVRENAGYRRLPTPKEAGGPGYDDIPVSDAPMYIGAVAPRTQRPLSLPSPEQAETRSRWVDVVGIIPDRASLNSSRTTSRFNYRPPNALDAARERSGAALIRRELARPDMQRMYGADPNYAVMEIATRTHRSPTEVVREIELMGLSPAAVQAARLQYQPGALIPFQSTADRAAVDVVQQQRQQASDAARRALPPTERSARDFDARAARLDELGRSDEAFSNRHSAEAARELGRRPGPTEATEWARRQRAIDDDISTEMNKLRKNNVPIYGGAAHGGRVQPTMDIIDRLAQRHDLDPAEVVERLQRLGFVFGRRRQVYQQRDPVTGQFFTRSDVVDQMVGQPRSRPPGSDNPF